MRLGGPASRHGCLNSLFHVPPFPKPLLKPFLPPLEGELYIDNLLARIHFVIVMISRTGLPPWQFEFPFPGSLTSTFLSQVFPKHIAETPPSSCANAGLLQQRWTPDARAQGDAAPVLTPGTCNRRRAP